MVERAEFGDRPSQHQACRLGVAGDGLTDPHRSSAFGEFAARGGGKKSRPCHATILCRLIYGFDQAGIERNIDPPG